MMRARPPRMATWLLQHLAAGWHRESLEGDLIEEYARGRGRFWFWRQTLMAIAFAQLRPFRARTSIAGRTWIAARAWTLFFRVLTELAVVLGAVSIVDRSRDARIWQDMLNPAFVTTMAILVAVAFVGLRLPVTLFNSKRSRGPLNHLTLFFAMAALGAGTLSWASATRRQCTADACHCQNAARQITAPQIPATQPIPSRTR